MANNKKVRFKNITWSGFENDCIKLSKKLKSIKADKIIAISRGGLVASRILSDLLSIPISHISISSYLNLKQEKEPLIEDVPKEKFKNKTLLIIDDVSDSGKTLKRAISYFNTPQQNKIYTATVYIKPGTTHIPDFWIKKTSSWIIFPYEMKETAKAFLKIFKTTQKAKNELKKLGFSKSKIEFIISK
jgi:hypothetical protein